MSTVLPGRPQPLLDNAERYIASADRIADAARFLTELALSGRGDSVSAITTRATDSAGDLTRAHGRYSGTAHALKTYAVDLADLHHRAQQFAEAEAASSHQAAAAAHDVLRLERTRDIHAQNGASDQILQQWEDQIRATERRRDALEHNAAQARQVLRSLEEQLDEAAERAISRINQATEGTDDSFWEKLAAFVDDVGSFFATVATWARDFLAKVLEVVLTAIAVVVVAILALVVIIAAVALLAVAIVALVKVLAVLLASPLFWTAVALLAAYIVSRIASDVRAPTPTIGKLDPNNTNPDADLESQIAQAESAQSLVDDPDSANLENAPLTAESLLERAGDVDRAGSSSKSVVDIQKVVGPDGVTRWIVTLPSTQDWVIGGDGGATNDLDANLALMLTPGHRTQYERAVYLAMAEAGIGRDEPILMVGFSQGGIMAAHLAANRQGDYNIDGVLAVGSPIDRMAIPPDVQVVSVQHTVDPVPMLDGKGATERGPNWQTYGGGPTNPLDAHSVDAYRETVRVIDAEQGNVISNDFSDFLQPPKKYDSYQYEWAE